MADKDKVVLRVKSVEELIMLRNDQVELARDILNGRSEIKDPLQAIARFMFADRLDKMIDNGLSINPR